MCNYLHKHFTPIEESGKGWKYFLRADDGTLMEFISFRRYETLHENRCSWKNHHEDLKAQRSYTYGKDLGRFGFCFFKEKPSEKHNNVIKAIYNDPRGITVLKEIKYSKGLGEVKCEGFIDPAKFGHPLSMALCRKFKLIDDGTGDHL